jgi:peptidyl-tRNA hydrolase
MTDLDPIIMYTVVRRSLNLSAGKVGGQCQHAMDYVAREVERLLRLDIGSGLHLTEPERGLLVIFREWQTTKDHTKIILGATDEEFEQAKIENPRHFLVTDLGRTEVAPNTPTCFGLWPMRKSRRSPILTRLKRL